ncbi:hypothetical protein [Pseudomonas syringae]|uniref:hypothetical protein n=1 Tax=Pseudomonas syringae TaxID=317 RepID=UPI001F2234CB|nr:hypothetical protein [Pseudomonas syringae]MCF5374144.1 hypothetical protein [Pseudomonas syringae]
MIANPKLSPKQAKFMIPVFFFAVCFVLYVTRFCYKVGGTPFAASFAIACFGFLLVAASLLFKFKNSNEIIAIISLAIGMLGVFYFTPTDSIAHDPLIGHAFNTKGGTVTLEGPCVWANGEKGQMYYCDLIVEPKTTKAEPAPAIEPAS